MTIDWSNFTPWSSLAGGIVLGIASALFVLMNGRILGISGIIGGLVKRRPGDSGWRIAFVLGLLAAPTAWTLFAPPAAARIDAGWLAVVAAGLLVGYPLGSFRPRGKAALFSMPWLSLHTKGSGSCSC